MASPVTSDQWEIYEASFILMECDSGAQGSFARSSLIVAAANSLAQALMEADRYDLVSRLVEIRLADETKGMGEIVTKANTGVRRHGMRATVLSKIGSTTEEGSDVLGCDDAGTACWYERSVGSMGLGASK